MPPSFTLKDQEGRNVSLSKFKGKPVVVYFYPADETPGCTKQVLYCIVLYFLGQLNSAFHLSKVLICGQHLMIA